MSEWKVPVQSLIDHIKTAVDVDPWAKEMAEMNDNDLITRREVELVLLKKGQKTKRYKWGETWELNFGEIREALSEYQSEIVRCKDCKHLEHLLHMDEINGKECYVCRKHTFTGMRSPDWYCADGERR